MNEEENWLSSIAHAAQHAVTAVAAKLIFQKIGVIIATIIAVFVGVAFIFMLILMNGTANFSVFGLSGYFIVKNGGIDGVNWLNADGHYSKQDQIVDDYLAEHPADYEKYYYDPQTMSDNIDSVIPYMDPHDDGVSNLTKENWHWILDAVLDYENGVTGMDKRKTSATDNYTYYVHSYTKAEQDNSGGAGSFTNDFVDSSDESSSATGKTSTSSIVKYEGVSSSLITSGPNAGRTWYTYSKKITVSDVETSEELGTVNNMTALNDPLFRVSWEEIFALASIIGEIDDSNNESWEQDFEDAGDGDINVKIRSRLTEEQVKKCVDAMKFTMVWNYNPASDGISDYYYEDMEGKAYRHIQEGVNVEHGTEDIDTTESFVYTEKKIPAEAPAYAYNSYMLVEYDYNDEGYLEGRQIVIDPELFISTVCEIFDIDEEDFYIELYCDSVKELPGSKYDITTTESQGIVASDSAADLNSICGKMNLLMNAYVEENTFIYYDEDFDGVHEVKLGDACPRNAYDPSSYGGIFNGSTLSSTPVNLDGTEYQPIASASAIVSEAMSHLGSHYKWGGSTLDVYGWESDPRHIAHDNDAMCKSCPVPGVDCSGFVYLIYTRCGVPIADATSGGYVTQSCFTSIPPGNAQPGDLIHYSGHIAIVVSVNGSTVTTVEANRHHVGVITRTTNLTKWDYALHYIG